MKDLGITRQLDNLGRIVLPAELRKKLDIEDGASLDIYLNGADIVLRKSQPTCTFCGNSEHVAEFKGKLVCSGCADELGELST